MPADRNLVLITIDAWRADFAREHAGVRLTPALDSVAERTVSFSRMYANAPWTTPALVSLFTGERVDGHGVFYEWSSPRVGTDALVKRLRAAGWNAPNLCYLNSLENYANLGYTQEAAPESPHDPDDDLLIPALRDTPEPYFLWFHYKFVHLPYWPAAEHRRALGLADADIPPRVRDSVGTGFVVPRSQFQLEREDRDVVQRLYAAGVRQMNDWLSRVLETIDTGPAADRTTVVLTADHGDELLEHGHVGHASTAHHATLFDEVLQIPLFVIDPRIDAARRIPHRAQGLDIFPTLLGLMGEDAPPRVDAYDWAPWVLASAGQTPAVPLPDPERLFYFHAARMGCPTPRSLAHQYVEGVTNGRRKLVCERFDSERDLLFDLEGDPGETRPLDDPGQQARWLARLREFVGRG